MHRARAGARYGARVLIGIVLTLTFLRVWLGPVTTPQAHFRLR